MDLDLELAISDRPSRSSSSRPTRFQPKAKFRPKPKLEAESDSPSSSKKQKEDLSLLSPHPPQPSQPIEASNEEVNAQESGGDVDGDGGVAGDDGDGVVREIDVFFKPAPLDKDAHLYVMQYPLRPCWRPYELKEKCIEVRVKPKEARIEIDLEINVDDENYDQEVGKPFRIEKQTLSSSKATTMTGYAVGILLGNKLHLNPVHAVVQLRPSMKYLTAGKLQVKNTVTKSMDSLADPDVVIKEESVTTKQAQGKGKQVPDAEIEKNNDEAEPWVSLGYHDVSSSFSRAYRGRMATEEGYNIPFSMSLHGYMNSLCSRTYNEKGQAGGLPRRHLLAMHLEERFKKWLSEGPHINRFCALMHLAPADSKDDVLKVLQQFADLVQGVWVAKSSLRCVGAEVLARDYILLLFSRNRFIHHDELKGIKVPNEILKRILTSVAVERSVLHDWKFKDEDGSFIKTYPYIVEEQRKAWFIRAKHITDAMHRLGRSSFMARKNPSKPGTFHQVSALGNADEGPKGIVEVALSSGNVIMSEETREALPRALAELFRIHKVCSLQLICQGLRDMAVSKSTHPKSDARMAIAAAQGAKALPQLESILEEVAIKIHGVYVLKSSGNAAVDPFRSLVISLLSASLPNQTLKKAEILEAAKIALKREVPNAVYNQVMNELCVSVKGSAWMLKRGDGKPK